MMFIIPGFMESVTDSDYQKLKRFLVRKGFVVKLVSIRWKYKTITDYITEFEHFYLKNKSDNNSVLGFSYGAVIAFSAAQKLGVNRLYLCSLSPDFSEDVIDMRNC